MKINILGMCEVTWTGGDKLIQDNPLSYNSEGDKHERSARIIY